MCRWLGAGGSVHGLRTYVSCCPALRRVPRASISPLVSPSRICPASTRFRHLLDGGMPGDPPATAAADYAVNAAALAGIQCRWMDFAGGSTSQPQQCALFCRAGRRMSLCEPILNDYAGSRRRHPFTKCSTLVDGWPVPKLKLKGFCFFIHNVSSNYRFSPAAQAH
jgi:hypothetical protein